MLPAPQLMSCPPQNLLLSLCPRMASTCTRSCSLAAPAPAKTWQEVDRDDHSWGSHVI